MKSHLSGSRGSCTGRRAWSRVRGDVFPRAVAVADGTVLLAGRRRTSSGPLGRLPPDGVPRRGDSPGRSTRTPTSRSRGSPTPGTPLPVPPSFVDWILRVIAWRRGAEPASFASISPPRRRRRSPSAHDRGRESPVPILRRTTAVPCGACLRGRDRLRPGRMPEVLALVSAAIDRLERISAGNPLVQAGVSPHTLYTVGERLLRSLAELAAAKGLPACLHLAESLVEMTFLADGGGEIASRLYPAVGRTSPDSTVSGGRSPRTSRGRSFAGRGAAGAYCPPRASGDRRPSRGGARFVCARGATRRTGTAPRTSPFRGCEDPVRPRDRQPRLGAGPLPLVEMRAARGLYKGRKKDAALCRELFPCRDGARGCRPRLPGGSSPRANRLTSRSLTTPAGTATDSSGNCWRGRTG